MSLGVVQCIALLATHTNTHTYTRAERFCFGEPFDLVFPFMLKSDLENATQDPSGPVALSVCFRCIPAGTVSSVPLLKSHCLFKL